jgi:hypothetical protein
VVLHQQQQQQQQQAVLMVKPGRSIWQLAVQQTAFPQTCPLWCLSVLQAHQFVIVSVPVSV